MSFVQEPPLAAPIPLSDQQAIERSGRSVSDIIQQVQQIQEGSPRVAIERPCTPEDGITVLDARLAEECTDAWRLAARGGRVQCFVPASGAATRMFASLVKAGQEQDFWNQPDDRSDLEPARKALAGRDSLPFFGRGLHAKEALRRVLLDERIKLPKGLIPFHRYETHTRTAFEEHLTEAASLCGLTARVHFSVSEANLERFYEERHRVVPRCVERNGTSYDIQFSLQDPTTDTVALDPTGALVRNANNEILFRPGGHGALLRNIANMKADLVAIKNIDNVVTDDHREPIVELRRQLIGYAAILQQGCEKLLATLDAGESTTDEAMQWIQQHFAVEAPEGVDKATWVRSRLQRPLRVCGMVPVQGEPGGGPFWVREKDGTLAGQIVEGAQINTQHVQQRNALSLSTHFNPVDMVCALRDTDGADYDLNAFVDSSSVIVTRKTIDGKAVRIMERPGLWNGSMAFWNTAFVHLPVSVFHPVKTAADLLREKHQHNS